MELEFQIHGVISGQKTWKQEDKDYYVQFYSGQTEDVLMIVEIVNRPHGLSTYYNYLRNNNVFADREGSYFGMTLRIDGGFCRDVKSIYMILDNLFNKMIVGSLLSIKGDRFEYSVDSFASQNVYLTQVEKQFSNMLNAFCSPQDFHEITSAFVSQGTKYSVNSSDITIPVAEEAIKQKAKIYLSPSYQSKAAQKKIADAKAEAAAAVADAQAKMQAAEDAHSQSKQKQKQESENWKQERQKLEQERDKAIRDYQDLANKAKRAELNNSINEKISEIKQPLIELAGLMAERFQEDSFGNIQEKPLKSKNNKVGFWGNSSEKSQYSKNNPKENGIPIWIPWALCVLLGIGLAGTIWFMDNPENSNQSSVIKEQSEKIKQLEDSIKHISNAIGDNNQSVGRGNTETDANNTVKYNKNKLWINIIGLASGVKTLTAGKTYTCEMSGGDYPTNGYWVICEGDKRIEGNVFTVSTPSNTQVTITYYYGTEVIKERKINVQ